MQLWPAVLAAAAILAACSGGAGSKPFAYTDEAPYQSCRDLVNEFMRDTAAGGAAESPTGKIETGFTAVDSEGNEWDFWGRVRKGPRSEDKNEKDEPDQSNDSLIPYDRAVLSYWFAWNTIWPTAELWSREKPEEIALRSEDYFDTYPETQFGTDLSLFVGRDERRVQTDLFDKNSPNQNPITRACFEEKDCLPSLVTEDDEGGTLWARCTGRPGKDEEGNDYEPDHYPCGLAKDDQNRFYCCGWDEKEPPYCCDAVDLPRYNIDMTKLSASQIQTHDNDHLREKKWYMRETDLVFGAVIGDEARAYPLKIFWWHEVINDRWVDPKNPSRITRYSLAYSALTDSLEVLDTTDQGDPSDPTDDRAYSLGIAGFTLNTNHILYDRLTESWWSPLRFQTIRGALPSDGPGNVRGCPFPAVKTTWAQWKKWFPNTFVLGAETGFKRNYTLYPYRQSGAEYLTDYRLDDDNTFRVTNPKPEHFVHPKANEPSFDPKAQPEYVKNKERAFGVVTPFARKGYLLRDVLAKAQATVRKEQDEQGKDKPPQAGSTVVDGRLFSTNGGARFAVINDRIFDRNDPSRGIDVVVFWEREPTDPPPSLAEKRDERILEFPPDRIRIYLSPTGADGKLLELFVPGSK